MSAELHAPPRSLPAWLRGLLLMAMVAAAYLPVWKAGFIWDDDMHLTSNGCIIGPQGLREIWTTSAARICPLTLTTFWIEHQLWGLRPLPYHLVNVALHAANALLLWQVLRRMHMRGAWLGAALWALHPVQVETVAWITELKNTQSGFFFLLTILCFLRWLGDSQRRVPGYLLVTLCAALAMASKSSTVVLPVVLGLCWWWTERRWRWSNTKWLLPIFLLSAASAALSIWTQQLEGGLDAAAHRSLEERFIGAGAIFWSYLGKLLWPHPLCFIYPRWNVQVTNLLWWLPSLFALAALVLLWKYRVQARAGLMPFLCFGVLLLPVLGLVNHYFFRYSFIGDHFQYLASMAPLAAMAAALMSLPSRVTSQIGGSVVITLFGILSWQHAHVFTDSTTLWEDTLAKNPDCWMAINNRGSVLMNAGRLDEARSSFERSLAIYEGNYEAHNNLGHTLMMLGQFDDAVSHLKRAIALNPRCSEARLTLGAVYFRQSRIDDALTAWLQLADVDPNASAAYANIAAAQLQLGRVDDAIATARQAVKAEPEKASNHVMLGVALVRAEHFDEAIASYQKAIAINPEDASAQFNIAQVLQQQRRIRESMAHFADAVRLMPDNAQLIAAYTWMLATTPDSQLRDAKRALELATKASSAALDRDVPLLRSLAAAYAANGQFDEAKQIAERALLIAKQAGQNEFAEIIRQDQAQFAQSKSLEDPSLQSKP